MQYLVHSLFALSYFLRPKVEKDRADLFESQYPKTPGEVIRRDVLGHIRTGGWRYYYHTDEKNLSLVSVWIVGDGPMEGVSRIKINDRDICLRILFKTVRLLLVVQATTTIILKYGLGSLLTALLILFCLN